MSKYKTEFKLKIVNEFLKGLKVQRICEKYAIPRSTVYYWLKQHGVIHSVKGKSITAKDYYLLEKKYRRIKTDYQILKECGGKIDAPRKAKLKIISKLDGKYTIHALCRVLGERRSNYYHYKYRRPNETEVEKRDAELKPVIKRIFVETKGRLGAKKIRVLIANQGYHTTAKRVNRLMKEMELVCRSKKKKYNYNFSGSVKYKRNLLNREFNPPKANLVWASDITYIYVNYKLHYMCSIIDLFSRKVIGYQVSSDPSASIVMDAFRIALEHRRPEKGLVFHSDLGVQYTSYQFGALLRSKGIKQSFSNPGCPYDNAVVESFYRSLKSEEVYRIFYKTYEDMRESIDEYVAFFNNIRPHQRLKYLTPRQYEEMHLASQ